MDESDPIFALQTAVVQQFSSNSEYLEIPNNWDPSSSSPILNNWKFPLYRSALSSREASKGTGIFEED